MSKTSDPDSVTPYMPGSTAADDRGRRLFCHPFMSCNSTYWALPPLSIKGCGHRLRKMHCMTNIIASYCPLQGLKKLSNFNKV
ncbi:hypothetical protein GDO78_009831 [Eleutherodactylus coqui]|uniref:Uncharacterized protein n=1 Tax=Eleutherodactylus coqui TaxID=57060 RepID=A0A8J6K9J0_ELECQ|nr:hypothetical protein GDO78_009831 [Eleutherodactylus coqui]